MVAPLDELDAALPVLRPARAARGPARRVARREASHGAAGRHGVDGARGRGLHARRRAARLAGAALRRRRRRARRGRGALGRPADVRLPHGAVDGARRGWPARVAAALSAAKRLRQHVGASTVRRMSRRLLLVCLLAGLAAAVPSACALAGGSKAGAAAPFRLARIATAQEPVYVAQPPGDSRLFVVEQIGVIRVFEHGKLRARPWLDLRSTVSAGGERGLLSIAFHPKFASNGKLYVDFTDRSGDTRIWELHARPGAAQADPGHRQLLFIAQPYPNHNGGQLQFGPDGYLYI